MTDRITCPDCQGRRGLRFGDLFFACRFCAGLGHVSSRNEAAAHGEPPDSPPPAWKHQVRQDNWIADVLGCRICLGAGRVMHVDRAAGTLMAVPCRRRDRMPGVPDHPATRAQHFC
ncbi:hypothetical protein ACIBIZ_52620 [Nonomuraea spiralis]|uniref:hypothetical protein n=1 Tax=Nonomuraea spiralis TaxID=46182 RepID=UPI003788964C